MRQDKAQDKQRGKILLVEDERVITRICTKVLTTHGFEVDIAPNGDVARDMIHKKDYDLCLSDIRTPKMDGMEFYRYLESKRHPLAGKLIFTTGDVLSEDIKNFLAEVNRPFLPKPFTPQELIRTIKKSIE